MTAPELGMAAWPAAMFVWGPGFISTPHRHPCMQLTMTLRGTLRIRGGAGTAWRRCGATLVRHNAVHEIDAHGVPVMLAYVHAESELGVTLEELMAGDITCLNPRL